MKKCLRDCLSFLHSDGVQGGHLEAVIDAKRERYKEQG